MLIRENGGMAICTRLDDKTIELNGSLEWTVWMKRVRNLSDNTIRTFASSMDRFWQWSLANPVGKNENFTLYLARYREDLREGFVLEEVQEDERFSDPVKVPVLVSRPMTRKTVNREMAGIRSFFTFSEEDDLLYDHRYINYLYERHKSRRSRLAGMQVRKGRLALEHSGARRPFLAPYRTPKSSADVRYFPPGLFDELLKIAEPRERLIYLLCGACSARIGQALNLTLYDIDYEKRAVWLLDPKGDEYPGIHWVRAVPRKRWLREEYGIDIEGGNMHNVPDLQFKYPIPLDPEALYWIDEEKYRALFFETLPEYLHSKTFLSESLRHPRHPFLFVTRNGKRVRARETLFRFKRHLRILVDRELAEPGVLDLGLHSLRHMFGHSMAELYAATGNEALVWITQRAMGHSSLDSTLVYFRLSEETRRRMVGEAHRKIVSREGTGA